MSSSHALAYLGKYMKPFSLTIYLFAGTTGYTEKKTSNISIRSHCQGADTIDQRPKDTSSGVLAIIGYWHTYQNNTVKQVADSIL